MKLKKLIQVLQDLEAGELTDAEIKVVLNYGSAEEGDVLEIEDVAWNTKLKAHVLLVENID